ncbi:saccharopine dehydrogenase [Nonomuraea typhae]|uniref:saccharopine dehydrogenase n=1 Tax=Nonomuraea typhae TaxID=2603600 RepID=UPI0015E2296C|nr:saccharopine dehydrogenase [Nonomuraea typhae]
MIGVLGATGAVGRRVAELLEPHGVRRGSRSGPGQRVDAYDPAGLAAFCAGCRLVVNCAGPSHRLLDRVARAAFAAGADYVDAAGDDPLFGLLSSSGTAGRTAIVSAGMLPGLTGLLPRLVTAHGTHRLDVYTGGRDRLTPAAAEDVLLSRGYGEALAAWRGGVRVSRALTPAEDVALPYFPERVSLHPYLTTEAERLARRLSVGESHWYTVTSKERVLALARGSAADLERAAALELAGRAPYYAMLFQAVGPSGTGTLALRTADTAALTAAVAAHAAEEVLAGAVRPGAHYAADVLDPEAVLAAIAPVARVDMTRALPPVDPLAPIEEGEL